MKVALVGCAQTWKEAPFRDLSWHIWAHASCQPLHPARVDRWFDIHAVSTWRQGKTWYAPNASEPATYVEWLQTRFEPITMQGRYPLIPTSEPYPLKELVEAFGIVPAAWKVDSHDPAWWELVKDRAELTSTAAFMMALALYQGADEIALYGIDFIGKDTRGIERTVQRIGMKYWIGVARGMGVPVTVARDSWLEWAPWLYGYEAPSLQEV